MSKMSGCVKGGSKSVKKKKAIVFGAGGFIGHHMVTRLKDEGYWVRGVDVKMPKFSNTEADDFVIADLTDIVEMKCALNLEGVKVWNEIYQFAADMGGAGYVFTGLHDLDIMLHSCLININLLKILDQGYVGCKKLFYSSSACIYPEENQMDVNHPYCEELSAYPAHPDSEYGWEKLFSERLYLAFAKEHHKTEINIARFHNIFGPLGTYEGGKEKAPVAFCRKIALAKKHDIIEMWGDGKQTRSFLYISDCLDGVRKLMDCNTFFGPVNIGSETMVSINELVNIISVIAGKSVLVEHVKANCLGVRGRNSHNRLVMENLGWEPKLTLGEGLKMTYAWIKGELDK